MADGKKKKKKEFWTGARFFKVSPSRWQVKMTKIQYFLESSASK
jgi:hypothetical protein